jgi:hypothetical protein
MRRGWFLDAFASEYECLFPRNNKWFTSTTAGSRGGKVPHQKGLSPHELRQRR